MGKRLRSSDELCVKFADFECLDKIGEGTFGEVFRAKRKLKNQDGKEPVLALKRIIFPYEQPNQILSRDSALNPEQHRRKLESEGFPLITLREIMVLKACKHPNIIELEDIAIHRENNQCKAKIYYVFPFMDHDMAGLLDNKDVRFTQAMIKCYLQQMLSGIQYLHHNQILHRDIKPANLLISHEGILKITDFGLARPLDKDRDGNYTPKVVTRWYRAPEVCLEAVDYTVAIDIWSMGCILGEMFLREVVMKGVSDVDQIYQIFRVCGMPDPDLWGKRWRKLKGATFFPDNLQYKSAGTLRQLFATEQSSAILLLEGMLSLDPEKRWTAEQCLDSDYLWSNPLPAKPENLPKFKSSHEFFSQTAIERRKTAR